MGTQGGEEVERGKDARRGGVGAGAALSAVVDDLAGFGAIAHAFQGYRGVSHVAGQAPPCLVVIGIDPLSLENGNPDEPNSA